MLLNPNAISQSDRGSSIVSSTTLEDRPEEAKPSRDKRLRIICWVFLAITGAIQAWFFRHYAFSDGVSYLEIASYYVKGDWHSALNSYWSPLYSWILAVLIAVFKTGLYWQPALMHLVNYVAYLLSLFALEVLIADLISFRKRHIGPGGFSETTVRLAGYAVFMVAGLLLIGLWYNSPDTVAMAIGFYLLHCLMKIEAGTARTSTYLLLGFALALEYLCRAAFAVFVPFYILLAAVLLWNRKAFSWKPIGYALLAAFITAAPFVIALSLSKSRFTIGEAGKLNYGWEVDGAARSTNWQGEPYDIGKPVHTTHQELTHPATFTFANSPVPGNYPLWYEPSYWYEGIRPHFKLKPQMQVLFGSLKGVLYLIFRSPITIPVLFLAYLMGWRRWLSGRGIFAYWFLLLPTSLYVLAYCLVFLDARYIAGSLIVIWMCLLTSVTIADASLRRKADKGVQVFAVLFALVFTASKLNTAIRVTANDLIHRRETYPNFNWILAERLRQEGFKPGDKIAMMGMTIDSEWARVAGLKIVGEIPIIWERDNQLFRRILADRKELKAFWWAKPQVKQQVYQAFRNAGAVAVIADYLPKRAAGAAEWTHLLHVDETFPPEKVGQADYRFMSFRRLDR